MCKIRKSVDDSRISQDMTVCTCASEVHVYTVILCVCVYIHVHVCVYLHHPVSVVYILSYSYIIPTRNVADLQL